METAVKPGIPLWFKLAYSAFCAVLVPTYLMAYGPTNFLYFCDVALLTTLAAVWLESPLSHRHRRSAFSCRRRCGSSTSSAPLPACR